MYYILCCALYRKQNHTSLAFRSTWHVCNLLSDKPKARHNISLSTYAVLALSTNLATCRKRLLPVECAVQFIIRWSWWMLEMVKINVQTVKHDQWTQSYCSIPTNKKRTRADANTREILGLKPIHWLVNSWRSNIVAWIPFKLRIKWVNWNAMKSHPTMRVIKRSE